MPALVDTTIRLLSQDPLAAHVETGRLLEVARVLDGAGGALVPERGAELLQRELVA